MGERAISWEKGTNLKADWGNEEDKWRQDEVGWGKVRQWLGLL